MPKRINKPLFWAGLGIVVVAAGALLLVEKDLGSWPIFMAFLGIVSMAASGYRPMKGK